MLHDADVRHAVRPVAEGAWCVRVRSGAKLVMAASCQQVNEWCVDEQKLVSVDAVKEDREIACWSTVLCQHGKTRSSRPVGRLTNAMTPAETIKRFIRMAHIALQNDLRRNSTHWFAT